MTTPVATEIPGRRPTLSEPITGPDTALRTSP